MILLSFLFSPFGRIGRPSWWTLQLINAAIMVLVASIAFTPFLENPNAAIDGVISGNLELPSAVTLALLLTLWIGFCASVKRYHDRGKTGLWIIIGVVPVIGPIWQLIELGSLSGTRGANAFGEQPTGFGATHSSLQKTSSGKGGGWGQNMDDVITDAVTNLAAEQSRPAPQPAPVKKLNPNFANGGRTSFGQRGIS